MKVYEVLRVGRDQMRTANEISWLLGCSIRDVSEQVERERRQGIPICASDAADNPGYYLAEDPDDLRRDDSEADQTDTGGEDPAAE